nr:twin-arginine translocase subunit TatC [Candidatus Nitrosocosmicus hydrocola]
MGLLTFVCMSLGVSLINLNGYEMPTLHIDTFNNLSVQIISLLKNDLIPNNVNLVQTAPGQSFYAQLYVALIVGLVCALPLIYREFIAFINPALYHHENKVIKKTLIPMILLFILGCVFSYNIVIPYTLEFLYKYGQSIEITSFFEITSFVTFTLNMLVVFGFSFQIPIIMWAITKSGLVERAFWKNNIGYIVIFLIIIGALLTPDGSGITMWFITIPLIVLYIAGLAVIRFDSMLPIIDQNQR